MAWSTSAISGPTARARDRSARRSSWRCGRRVTSQKKNPLGAWRYSPDAHDADTSVSGAVFVGLLAARNAGIEVPDEAINKAITFYAQMTSASGEVAYAGGMGGFGESLARSSIATLVFSVARRKDLKQFKATLDYLKQRIDQVAQQMWPEYARYYEAQALFQGDVAAWEKWNKLLVRQLKAGPGGRRQLPRPAGQLGQHVALAPGAGGQFSLLADLRTIGCQELMRYKPVRIVSDCQEASLLRLAAVGRGDHGPDGVAACAADRGRQPPPAAVLHLTDGSFVAGELDDSARPGVLRWQASAFVSPFEFPRESRSTPSTGLRRRRCPSPKEIIASSWPAATSCSAPWSPWTTRKPSSTFRGSAGCTCSDRAIHRIYRWRGSADLVYLGPNGLAGWSESRRRTASRPRVVVAERRASRMVHRSHGDGRASASKAGVKSRVSS